MGAGDEAKVEGGYILVDKGGQLADLVEVTLNANAIVIDLER